MTKTMLHCPNLEIATCTYCVKRGPVAMPWLKCQKDALYIRSR